MTTISLSKLTVLQLQAKITMFGYVSLSLSCVYTTSMYLCVYVPMCVFVIRSGWSIRTCFLLAWLRERQPQISRLLTPLGLNTSLLWLNIKLQSMSLDLVQMVLFYFNVFHPFIVSPFSSFFLPCMQWYTNTFCLLLVFFLYVCEYNRWIDSFGRRWYVILSYSLNLTFLTHIY